MKKLLIIAAFYASIIFALYYPVPGLISIFIALGFLSDALAGDPIGDYCVSRLCDMLEANGETCPLEIPRFTRLTRSEAETEYKGMRESIICFIASVIFVIVAVISGNGIAMFITAIMLYSCLVVLIAATGEYLNKFRCV